LIKPAARQWRLPNGSRRLLHCPINEPMIDGAFRRVEVERVQRIRVRIW